VLLLVLVAALEEEGVTAAEEEGVTAAEKEGVTAAEEEGVAEAETLLEGEALCRAGKRERHGGEEAA
jgi:hypothetical protein